MAASPTLRGQSVAAPVPYFTDFENGAGAEWSLKNLEQGESFAFTRFSGRFSNETNALAVTNLVVGQSYTIGFDLYALDSLDGNSAPGDYINVSIDGLQVFHYTFANYGTQSYPFGPDEGRSHFGFHSSYIDSMYRNIEITFTASNTSAAIAFSGENLQPITDESWGIDNVSVRLSADVAAPFVRSSTLPPHGSTANVAIDGFSIYASRPLSATTANNAANYSLRDAGLNGALGDGDDVIYSLTPSFAAGRSVSFTIANGPLQPRPYRFQTTSGLQTTNGTPLTAFTNDFTVAHPTLGRIENTSNNTLATGTALPTTESPASSAFFTAFASGVFGSTTDVDYWRFEAETGDRLTVRLEADASGVSPQLQLRNASDQNIQSGAAGVEGVIGFQNYTITSPGTYYLRVWSTTKRASYRMRVDQSRGPQMESEANNSQGIANVLNLTASPGLYLGRIVGALPGDDTAGDFFRLGTLNVGNAINVDALFPSGSTLSGGQTTLSIHLEGNTNALATVNAGTLNYTVVSNGVHYVRIETSALNLRAQYLLNFAVSDGVAPTISATSLPAEASATSGIVDRFTLTFSEEMVPVTISNTANYELRAAGGDAQFNTDDDAIYAVASAGYSGGLSASYSITDGPLQPGSYRLTVQTNLTDRANNPMTAPFVRNFTVNGVSGFTLENRRNGAGGFGTPISAAAGTNADGTVSFGGSVGVGARPHFITSGFFNGDTNLDLVTANYSGNNVSILLNNGTGSFGVATNIPTGSSPISVTRGDYNNDTLTDLVVANYSAGTLSILLGNGTGGFQVVSNYSGLSSPWNLVSGDFNGDNNLDLAVPNYGVSTISVVLGNGNGTFRPRTNYTVGSNPATVATGHLNGDGHLDLAVANWSSSTVSILLGNGSGAFQLFTNLPTGRNARYVTIGDVNGDTTADLVVLEPNDNTVSVFRGNGNATFQTRVEYATGTSDAYQAVLANLDGDGRPEIIVSGYGNNTVAILQNDGSGLFRNLFVTDHSGNPISIAPGDYNGDARIDLAIAHYIGNNVTLWLGNANNPLIEDLPTAGLSSGLARGNISSAGDIDYFRFSGLAGDLAIVAVDVPGNPAGTSVHVELHRADGALLRQFNTDTDGWGQSALIALPYTGTYLVRVSENGGYQGEYRIRVSTARPPMQYETELNNTLATADVPSYANTNGHLQARLGGYISYGDTPGDYYLLGNLAEGSTVSLSLKRPAGSGLAGILEIYNASGQIIASSAAGISNLTHTITAGQGGLHYARIRAGEVGHGGGSGATLRLDGVDDYVNIPNMANALPTTEVTVEFWQYTSTAKQQHTFLLSPENLANRFSAHVPWSDGVIYWDFGNYNTGAGRLSYLPPASILGAWHHFAFISSQSGNFMRIYRNGVLEASKVGSSSFSQHSAPLWIGGPPSYRLGGAIDEFRIWNTVRSEAEIQANMNSSLTGSEPGLVGYWRFDEGTGTNTADATVLDHDGILMNGATWGVDGTEVAAPSGLLAQYILEFDLSDPSGPLVTGDTLPAQGSTTTALINRFNVTFNEDVDPAFNALNRVIQVYDGHSYMLTDASTSWLNAEQQAVTLGGHLVTINNSAENQFVFETFTTPLWIGLSDHMSEGTFVWASGEPVTYSNWAGNQPDNYLSEDFIEMTTSGNWNDIGSTARRGLIEVAATTDSDSDGLVDGLDRFPSDPLNTFDLREAGVDLAFDTPDDVIYNLDTTGYSSGLTASFAIIDGPLQPGNYRLKVSSSLRDLYGNPLATPYVKNFTVNSVAGFLTENRGNNTPTTASSLSSNPTNSPDGSFSFHNAHALGVNPYFVVNGLFNNDTNLDLVTAEFTSGRITVLVGDGAAGFTAATNISTGGGAISIASGLLNADAHLDLAVANYNANTVTILAGDGNAGFQILSNYTGFNNPRNLTLGDFNGDSQLDLAVPNYGGNNISVLLGNGNGTFQPRVNYTVGNNPFNIAVGDLNADGAADLAVANYSSDTVSLLFGNGNGTFQAATNIALASSANPRWVAIARFNTDTNLDLVVLGGDNNLSVLAGNGDGTFQPRVNSPAGTSDPYHLVLADFDVDGDLDAVIGSYGSSRLVTVLNHSGVFGGVSAFNIGNRPISVAVGDYNHDGRPDVAAANYNGNNVSIVLGNATQRLNDDPAGTGLRLGAGRGALIDANDVDFWSFSGTANDRLFVSTESFGNPGSSSLCYYIFRPDGPELTSFCSDSNGRGQRGVVLPVSGTYTIRVTYNNNYFNEYRLSVVLARPPVQYETEGNDSTGAANTPALAFSPGHQTATVLGAIPSDDPSGDYFRLGNLASGTMIILSNSQPATSPLIAVLGIYNSAGALVTNTAAGGANLIYNVPGGGDGTYYARVTASGGTAGLLSKYLLNIDLADTLAPSVTAASLPAEGTTSSNILDRFSLTFSEDMTAATVNTPGNYELRNAGGDDTFGTDDDQLYSVATSPAYSAGLTGSYVVNNGPLQPGRYRFTVQAALTDRAGNPLLSPFVRLFNVVNISGFVLEKQNNGTAPTATSFSLLPSPAPDGSLTPTSSIGVGANPHRMAGGLINNDTNIDLVVANYGSHTATVLLGNGDGTFQVRTNQPVAGGPVFPLLGHFDSDMQLDLAVACYDSSTLRIFRGNGDGTFQTSTNYAVGANPYSVGAGDFDADGDLDLVVANYTGDNISVFLGNGDGTFQAGVNSPAGDASMSVAVGDVNGDNKLDLVTANYNSDNLSLFLGNGNGTFAAPIGIAANSNPRAVVLAHLNGDANLDLAVANAGDNTLSIMFGNGDGSFQSRISYATGTSDTYNLLAADLNADNRLDLAVSGYGNSRLAIFLNRGAGAFESPAVYVVGNRGLGLVAGDFNHDGCMDLAQGNYSGNNVTVLLGNQTQLLADDANGMGLGTGRGNLFNTSDEDYWSFSARAGDRIIVASENPGSPNSSSLCYYLYKPDGDNLTSFCSDSFGRGELGAVAPMSGTYSVRVSYNNSFSGEYRLRVTLAPPPAQLESEDNNNTGQADGLTFSASAGRQTATVLGYINLGDSSGDYFRLGNLAPGTVVNVNYGRPNSSPLSGVLGIYNSAGTLISNALAGVTNLTVTIPAADAYFARISSANNTAGLFAQYILNLDFADTAPLAVNSVTLPAEGATGTSIIEGFSVNVSKDLDPGLNAVNRSVLFYGGHAYFITDSTVSWLSAQAQARAVGGHLVTVNDAAENAWLRANFPGTFWIGFTDEAQEGSFLWASGEALTYTNWNTGEPNNSGNEDYGSMTTNGRWNDANVSTAYRGVIEVSGTDTDGDGIPDTLDPYPADQYNVFDLRAAGVDGFFDTPDDEIYRPVSANYTTGLSLNFTIVDGPLQPGNYRFRITPSLRDRFGNGLAAAFERFFSVGSVPGFVLENRNNNSIATGTPLPLTEDPAGLKTASGRGRLLNNSDVDNWSFDGLAGEAFVLATEVPGNPSASQLRYELFQPNGTRILDFFPAYTGEGESARIILPTNGTYTVQVTVYSYSFHGEYRIRLASAIPPTQMESEANDTLATATAMPLAVSGDTRFGSIAGVVRNNTDLDYINLGTVTNGSSIFLNVRLPAGGSLIPVVSVYNAANAYQAEVSGGRPDDGVAEVRITQTGTYYALVRGGQGTGGFRENYVLDVQAVPTGTVSFPNLQVTAIGLPTTSGIQSGQQITYTFGVTNVGSLATPGANWSDRAALSVNTTLGDSDDVPLGFLFHNGALNPNEGYIVSSTITLPDCISGNYYIIVQTDAANSINEFVFEADNITVSSSTFSVNLAPYPDLRVEDLALTGPDSNHVYTVTWNTANRGTAPAPAGFKERFLVRNQTTGAVMVNTEQTIGSPLAVDATLPQVRTVVASNAATYRIEITADSQNNVFECRVAGDASAEQNTVSTNFQIIQLFTVALQSSPAGAGILTGAGTFASGSFVTVTAQPDTNALPYQFVNWTEGGTFQSANTNYTFVLTRNRSLRANFTLPSYQMAASNNPPAGGTVSGVGTFFHGTTNLLTANANLGYRFTNWTENGQVIETSNVLTTVVTSNRFVVANYTELNLFHTVATATSPTNLATVTGAGTYTNGQSGTFTAPSGVTNPPNIYTFKEFRLNGAFAGNSPTLTKLFSTLDPTNLQLVAVYNVSSILPAVVNASGGFTNPVVGGFTVVTNPVPATANYQITVQFDRSMQTAVMPTIAISNTSASVQPVVPAGSTWLATRVSNDTYRTPYITFSNGMDGLALVTISGAQDPDGLAMNPTNILALVIDVTPPGTPVLSLTASNNTSATVSWSSYSAPGDLSGFRVYRVPTNFTSVATLAPLTTLSSGTRSYTYNGLSLDTPYYVAVVAVDQAGNSLSGVTPMQIILPSSVPPPVAIQVSALDADSAQVSWTGYNTANLLGFAGFRLYYEDSNFSSVAGLTPKDTLGTGVRSTQVHGLDRSKTWYFAVVGYNGNNAFNPNVTTATWSDPYAGNIAANLTLGGAGETVDILQSITVVSNAVLAVRPGTTLRFAPGTSLTVQQGALNANGTALDPIVFTSAQQTAGAWNGLRLLNNAGASLLRHIFVRYGAGLTLDGCTPTVDAFTADFNSPAGLTLLNGATLRTSEALVLFNGIGLQQSGAAQLNIFNSVIKNNGTNAIASGSQTLIATQNWWGTAVSGDIDSGLQGTVNRSGFLTYEPLLTPAIAGPTQSGSRQVNLRLACRTAETMRLSEDSTFFAVFFQPFTNNAGFQLSDGGGQKTVFAQFRSLTGHTSAPVSVNINYITAGPTISAFSLSEGQVLRRPLTVTGSASAALGVAAMEFYVDNVLQSSTANGSFSQRLDVRTFSNAVHRVKLLARDNSGNFATLERNVTIAPEPPPAPVITTPAANLTVSASTLPLVSGTAEPLIDVRLSRGGFSLGTTTAAANGTFSFSNVLLIEGPNELAATAFDVLGTARSPERIVVLDSGPPATPVLEAPLYIPNQGLYLSWHYPTTGERASSYQLFWHTAPFTSTNQATGRTVLLRALNYTAQGLLPGTYYFGIIGFDDAGNASPLSPLQVAEFDPIAPSFNVAFDKASPVGVGPLRIVLSSSEALAAPPSLTLRPQGSAPLLLVLSNTALNTYESTLNVTPFTPSGPVQLAVSAQDLPGNTFNGAPAGAALAIDVQPPSGRISTAPQSPVQTTNNTDVAVNLILSEPAKPGTTPTLMFNPPSGSSGVPITLSGSGTNWSGILTLTPAMSSGNGGFVLTARDALDNIGHLITSGGNLEIYNTALVSPPRAPTGLQAFSLPGGAVRLSWNTVSNAELYSLYGEPGSNGVPTVLISGALTATITTNLPPADGAYRFAVSASRRGSESTNSNVVIAQSDRTPPPTPTNVVVQLVAAGVQISWQQPSGETPNRYHIYRNGVLLRSVTSVAPIVDSPPRGVMNYTIAAVDAVGNEAVSEPATIELLVGAVNNLTVLVNIGQGPFLTWTSGDATVTGFNIYRNGIKQNNAPVPTTSYTDSFPAGSSVVTYAVRAVNSSGQESAARLVNVYQVDLRASANFSGGTNNPLVNRYFDEFRVTVSNLTAASALPLRQLELRRTIIGAGPLTITNPAPVSVAALGNLERSIVFPGASDLNPQTIRVRAVQETDIGGSSVIYQSVFDFVNVAPPGTMIDIVANQIPLAGGLASIDLRIYNRGYADMDVLVSRNQGTQPGDVYIALRNGLGQEVSRTEYVGLAPGSILAPDGRSYLRIAPGASAVLTVPNVLVPEALGTNTTLFEAVASKIHYRLGSASELQAGPLYGSMISSLVQTEYYGTAQTDRPGYANDEPVIITGQALDRVSGAPKPNAALKIGFFTRGYRFYRDVTTDSSGSFQYIYNPPVGLAGSLQIWAAHPDVFDVLNQAQINIYRVYATPQRGDIRMSKNDHLDFSISLINPGDPLLTGFNLEFRAYQMQGTNQVPITTLTGTASLPTNFVLNARETKRINLRLDADLDAPDNAVVEFVLRSAQGAAARFIGTVTLLPAIPVLTVIDPNAGYVEMSVNRGNLKSRAVTIVNRGLRELSGVTLSPPTNLSWMQVTLPVSDDGLIHLPDIPVGGSNSFVVVFTPPEGAALNYHQDFLTIQGTNSPTRFRINLYALVTSSERGNIQFFVDNILTYPVPNATVRCKNTILNQEFVTTTDANGFVTITNLQEGDWAWQANAPGHSANVGVTTVVPDQTTLVETRLSKSLVTVNFTVEPVPFTDRYEIKIEQTFETHVPAPVLVITPPMLNFSNVSPGFEVTFIATAKNHGLIHMTDLTIKGSEAAFGSLTPLITYAPVLLPQETIEIPFRATYTGRQGSTQSQSGETRQFDGGGFADCATGGLAGLAEFLMGLNAIANASAACADLKALLMIFGGIAVAYSLFCSPNFSPIPVPGPCPSAPWPFSFIVNLISCLAQQFLSGSNSGSGGNSGSTSGGPIGTGSGYYGGNPACFVQGTDILMADGHYKPIEMVRIKDWVRSGYTTSETSHVREVIERTSDDLYEVHFTQPGVKGTNTSTIATGDHAFWVDGLGWTLVRDLKPDQWLMNPSGKRCMIGSIKRVPGPRKVYSLILGGDQAFFADDILVRDRCGNPWPAPPAVVSDRTGVTKPVVTSIQKP